MTFSVTPPSPGQRWRRAEWETRSSPQGHSRSRPCEERHLSPCVSLREPRQVSRRHSQAALAHRSDLGPTPPPSKLPRAGDRNTGGVKEMRQERPSPPRCRPDPAAPASRPVRVVPEPEPPPAPRPPPPSPLSLAPLYPPLGSSCVSSGRPGAFSGACAGSSTPAALPCTRPRLPPSAPSGRPPASLLPRVHLARGGRRWATEQLRQTPSPCCRAGPERGGRLGPRGAPCSNSTFPASPPPPAAPCSCVGRPRLPQARIGLCA